MKAMKALYHFLGGLTFAIFLLSSAALMVIAGTFIESAKESHLYAADLIYSSPLFGILLAGFFVNILIAALRRWPFKVRHIPFLTTHLGLLMILAGVMIKHYAGTQGSMRLFEGSSSDEILIANTHAIQVEGRGLPPMRYPLKKDLFGRFLPNLGRYQDIHLQLLAYSPNAHEKLGSWIKGKHAFLLGMNPLPIDFIDGDSMSEPLRPKGTLALAANSSGFKEAWQLFALKTSQPSQVVKKLYLQETELLVFHEKEKIPSAGIGNEEASIGSYFNATAGDNKMAERQETGNALVIPMEKAIGLKHRHEDAVYEIQAALDFSLEEGFQSPAIVIEREKSQKEHLRLKIALDGPFAGMHENLSTPYLGKLPFSARLQTKPLIAFIEDDDLDVHLVAIDSRGKVTWQSYPSRSQGPLLAYDDGFGGYAIEAALPSPAAPSGESAFSQAAENYFKAHLRAAIDEESRLSLPLQRWQEAAKKAGLDFADTLFAFLAHWHGASGWLYPPHYPLPKHVGEVIAAIDWTKLTHAECIACRWATMLFTKLDPHLMQEGSVLALLEEIKWPMTAPLIHEIKEIGANDKGEMHASKEVEENEALLTLVTQQLFSASASLKKESLETDEGKFLKESSLSELASHFSAYLRAYDIHLSSIYASFVKGKEELESLLPYVKNAPSPKEHLIETTVAPMQKIVPKSDKYEENAPLIELQMRKGDKGDVVRLVYDETAAGLKWPALNGQLLVRFQPLFTPIPYRLRLRQARKINYPSSQQPYSYEGDLLIEDLKSKKVAAVTLSMNKVYETWDGYRFYLAAMSPSSEQSIKNVQIIVNHDPAKYWLTYPGALILCLGVLALFYLRPYRSAKT